MNWKQFLKTFVTVVGSGAVAGVHQTIVNGHPLDWHTAQTAALTGAIGGLALWVAPPGTNSTSISIPSDVSTADPKTPPDKPLESPGA